MLHNWMKVQPTKDWSCSAADGVVLAGAGGYPTDGLYAFTLLISNCMHTGRPTSVSSVMFSRAA